MTKIDYYELLSIERNANDEEVKKAYRRMAVQYHPDRNPGNKDAEEKFKLINEAYQILSDPKKREVYDRFGHDGLRQGGFQGFEGGFGNFSDIFDNIFGDIFGGGASGGQVDLRYNLELTFEEAVFGTEKKIQFEKEVPCEVCDGSGARRGTKPKTCKTCHGTGQIRFNQGFFTLSRSCGTCFGQGAIVEEKCSECKGRGKTKKPSEVTVKIPAGVESDQKLRLKGEGESQVSGGRVGDLFVILKVREHSLFKRDSEHLYLEMPISFTQAALGAELDVPTLEGSAKVKIPGGIQNGHVIKLKGKGIKRLNGSGYGDQVIQFFIEIPSKLSSKQRELLKQLQEAEAESSSHPGILNFLNKVKEMIRK